MNIQVKWANKNQSIVLFKFPRKWDWDDFEIALETGFGLIESVAHRVNTIFDLSQSRTIPQGVMIYWGKMMKVLPSNHNKIAFVTGNAMAKTTVKMLRDINKRSASKIISTQNLSAVVARFMKDDPNKKTIVMVKDDDPLPEELVDLLHLKGYHVLEAPNR